MSRQLRAFTLIEVLFVVVIMGIIAAVVIPRVGRDGLFEYQIVRSTARQMAADIRLARSLAIAHGSTNSSGYSFDLTGSSPYTGWQVLNEDTSAVVGNAKSVDSAVRVTGIQNIAFDVVGGASFSGSNITLRDEQTPRTVHFRISITADTGRVFLEDRS